MLQQLLAGKFQIYPKDEDSECFFEDIEIAADGHGLTIEFNDIERLLKINDDGGLRQLCVYFDKDDLSILFDMLWESETIRAKPKFRWPLRWPKIELVIE